MDNGADWQQYLNSSQGNCTVDQIEPAQWSREMALKEVQATVTAVRTIAAKLLPLQKAVIINAGARLTQDRAAALMPFDVFFTHFNDIPNILWYALSFLFSQESHKYRERQSKTKPLYQGYIICMSLIISGKNEWPIYNITIRFLVPFFDCCA